jgi:FG-GAP-like repeat
MSPFNCSERKAICNWSTACRPMVVPLKNRRLLIPACLLALVFGTLFAAKVSAGFITAPTYPVGNSPAAVAVGDFNEDGNLDLVVASNPNNSNLNQLGMLSVLLGNGNGTFQLSQIYTVGKFPLSVAIGDFNGDGHLDLAVANALDSSVSILLGNGDRPPTRRVTVSLPSLRRAVR